MKYKQSRAYWLLILAGATVVAVADGAGTESTESPAADAYEQSCLKPYPDQLAGLQATQLDRERSRQVVLAARTAAEVSCSISVEQSEKDVEPEEQQSQMLLDARDLLAGSSKGKCLEARVVAARAATAGEALPEKVVHRVKDLFLEASRFIRLPEPVRSEEAIAELLATPETRAQLTAGWEEESKLRHILEDEVELARRLRGNAQMVELLDRDARLADWLAWNPGEAARPRRLGG